MSKTRKVQKYSDTAIERAKKMSKEDYQRIKHMNKIELVHYLDRLCNAAYKEGYDRGVQEGQKQAPNTETPSGIPGGTE